MKIARQVPKWLLTYAPRPPTEVQSRLNEEDYMRITSMGNGDDLNAFLESNSPLNDS